ncbi:hypothetical protein GCM10010435_81980 [Winogradskya consettensis]|uniref:DUF2716 domain-containing protein n=1 Tax=Winogradskya consettensis TaxID=113560 RepID=A0A919SUW6_9ACTN|nr:DUF2716 domain-containing protein [Actinoplanes consettensis]GIM79051.1 hypothetical protein Aco04nite_63560 [Actinoplanes consettensis]
MDALVDLTLLTRAERELLRAGVTEWERSEGDRDETARLLGYGDRPEMQSDVVRLAGLPASDRPVSRRDFRRLLLATELAFASETLGWARDWEADTGYTDHDTVTVLRGLQERVAGIVYGVEDRLVENGPPVPPAWEPISMDVDDAYWDPFYQRFNFRPSMYQWPAITEPEPSVTIDLGPIFDAGHAQFGAGASAINSLALVALTRVLGSDTSLVVLDWQHQSYRFWPHLFACQPDPQWATTVFPNGDYYIFLTEDMTTGTFGHPWERTLCVFGEPLVSTLVPMLTSWLPIKRTTLE